MAKSRVKYICTECGFDTIKWVGKCPQCENWNTFAEEIIEEVKNKRAVEKSTSEIIPLSRQPDEDETRLETMISEFDRVLGGGIVAGSVILLGGDPGIGKSTLIMQAAAKLTTKCLYVTGEESIRQINLRAKRLKLESESLHLLAETNVDAILRHVKKFNPETVIIDSIQTMFHPGLDNAPGTVTQIRESTSHIMQFAKQNGIAFVLIGHVTKEGFIAGPKVLEHMVDTVLQFEGEKSHSYRILRAQKNRFGSTNEIGIFEMRDSGLAEVKNPSEIFLSEREGEISGSVITATIEGTRPVLLEVQALVTSSNYGNPQRVSTGFDTKRLSILLAVLEKRAGLHLSAQNVFLNIAGGIRILEPAVDLAICASIASSLLNKIASTKTIVIGEVGLGGEVRSVGNIEKRIQEAEKLGFENIYLPQNNMKNLVRKNHL
ncbi:MAG: DNA repair protein RadA, partial [Melioribacteraceae bacterium]|nr:DNA repair protein RadA [Melioribacteraceae bacterium]